jgi:hypothetical protein
MVFAALALAACDSAAPVSVRFSGSNAMPSAGAGYTGDVGTVTSDQDGNTVLSSQGGGATLRLSIDSIPTTAGEKVLIGGGRHIEIEYTLNDATWVSNSGGVTFNTVASPYDVTFDHVEMIGAGMAKGAFFMDGSGQFAK